MIVKMARAGGSSRRDLEPGDIILTSMGDKFTYESEKLPKRLWYKLTQAGYVAASPRLQGPFTHAAMYVGNGKIVEADDDGVAEKSLRKATRKKAYVVLRPTKVSKQQRRKAALFARKQVGKEYDDRAMVGAGLALFLPKGVVNAVVDNVLKSPKDPASLQAFQCAGLVSAAYSAVGAPSPSGVGWRVTAPAHLLSSDHLKKIRLRRKDKKLHAPSRLSRYRESIVQRLNEKTAAAVSEKLLQMYASEPCGRR